MNQFKIRLVKMAIAGIACLAGATMPANAVTYYVDAVYGDNNRTTTQAQSSASPWKTITKALFTSNTDKIVVAAGTYPEIIYLNTKSNITFEAAPGARPIIRPVNAGAYWIFWIANQSNITIKGFEIDGSAINPEGSCVWIASDINAIAHHITIRDCVIHDGGGAGIATGQPNVHPDITGPRIPGAPGGADYITIEGNTIYNNCFFSPWEGSGISLYGLSSFNTGDTGFHNVIRGNRVFNNISKFTGRSKFEKDPNVTSSVHTDGNGMIMDISGSNAPPTLIENNLVYRNGGRGIHCYRTGNVVIRNNTCYKNCQDPYIQSGEITAIGAEALNIVLANNIMYSDNGNPAYAVSNPSSVTKRYNTYFCDAPGVGVVPAYGTWGFWGNPRFVAPAAAPAYPPTASSNAALLNANFQTTAAPQQTGMTLFDSQVVIDRGSSSTFNGVADYSATSFTGAARPASNKDRGAYETTLPGGSGASGGTT